MEDDETGTYLEPECADLETVPEEIDESTPEIMTSLATTTIQPQSTSTTSEQVQHANNKAAISANVTVSWPAPTTPLTDSVSNNPFDGQWPEEEEEAASLVRITRDNCAFQQMDYVEVDGVSNTVAPTVMGGNREDGRCRPEVVDQLERNYQPRENAAAAAITITAARDVSMGESTTSAVSSFDEDNNDDSCRVPDAILPDLPDLPSMALISEETVKTTSNSRAGNGLAPHFPVEPSTTNVAPVSGSGMGQHQEGGEMLPLVCWSCSQDFPTFEQLSEHIQTHFSNCSSSKYPRRHHRCPRCGEVLPSMWKLRQHLAKHQTLDSSRKGDHPYAERGRRNKAIKLSTGDHGYATCVNPKPLQDNLSAKTSLPSGVDACVVITEANTGKIVAEAALQTLSVVGTRASRRRAKQLENEKAVSTEHSYGSKRDSSPETDQGDAEEKKDHPYSVQDINHSLLPFEVLLNGSHNQPFSANNNTTDHQLSPTVVDVVPQEEPSEQLQQQQLQQQQQHQQQTISDGQVFGGSDETRTYVASVSLEKLPPRKSKQKQEKNAVFKCDGCTKVFPASYRLNRHVREVHNKEKSHKCHLCPKQFFKSTSLLRHKVGVHSKLRPFVCQFCSAGFKDQTALKYHTVNKVCSK